jgi:hypothetical protein
MGQSLPGRNNSQHDHVRCTAEPGSKFGGVRPARSGDSGCAALFSEIFLFHLTTGLSHVGFIESRSFARVVPALRRDPSVSPIALIATPCVLAFGSGADSSSYKQRQHIGGVGAIAEEFSRRSDGRCRKSCLPFSRRDPACCVVARERRADHELDLVEQHQRDDNEPHMPSEQQARDGHAVDEAFL